MRILSIFIHAALIASVVSSCATLKPADTENLATMADAKEIEGVYSNISVNKPEFWYQKLERRIDHRDQVKTADSITSVEIKIVDDRRIRFSFIDTKNNRHTYDSKYKLKDGKIKMKDKNFRLTGIPYVLGGYEINKTELSLTTDKNLVLRSAHVDEGAILIILPASVPRSDYENVYLRETIK